MCPVRPNKIQDWEPEQLFGPDGGEDVGAPSADGAPAPDSEEHVRETAAGDAAADG